MGNWILPTVSELLGETNPNAPIGHLSAEQGWHGARKALNYMLKSHLEDVAASSDLETPCWQDEATGPLTVPQDKCPDMTQGLILTGPLPVFNAPQILENFSTWVFGVPTWQSLWQLPADLGGALTPSPTSALLGGDRPNRPNRPISLLPADPLAKECFCLVMLPHFSLLFTCQHEEDGTAINFQFSFSPMVINEAWQLLRARIAITSGQHLEQLDNLVAQFMPVEPRYDVVMEFGQLLWQAIPAPRRKQTGKQKTDQYSATTYQSASQDSEEYLSLCPQLAADTRSRSPAFTQVSHRAQSDRPPEKHDDDVDFLRAFAHGIRTPLTTIRTYTQLLKRKKLSADVLKHLDKIDRECSEQIDRFDLIFKAVEMETTEGLPNFALHAFCLKQVISEGLDRWQRQAERHNLKFDVTMPSIIPPIAGDCDLLDQMLTELIETLIRSLSSGSRIALSVIPAGDRLKLELVCEDSQDKDGGWLGWGHSSFQAIGRLLSFQPETGSLSLNLEVTKNLFQSIGGKLTVRRSPQHGDVITIFLPIDNSPAKKNPWFV